MRSGRKSSIEKATSALLAGAVAGVVLLSAISIPAAAQQRSPAPAPAPAAPQPGAGASCFSATDPAAIVAGCDVVIGSTNGLFTADQIGLALQRRGGAKVALGRVDEAILDFQRMAASNFRAHEAKASIASIAFRRQRLADAEVGYREALRINPSYALAQTGLGYTLIGLGRPGEAIQHFDRALAISDKDVSAHLGRATALNATGDRAAAALSLDAALKLDPRSLPALSLRTEIAAATGDAKAAEAFADRTVAAATGEAHIRALVFRARLRITHKAFDTALADCRAAGVELTTALKASDQLRASTAYCVGLVQQNTGKLADAERSYAAAIAIAPNEAAPYAGRGYVFVQWGRYDEAIKDFETALRLDPRSQDAARFLGLAYADKGDLASAETAFSRALAIQANDPWPLIVRAISLAKNGDRTRAHEEANKVLAELGQNSSDGHLVVAVVAYFLQELDLARSEVETAIRLNAESGQAHRIAARIAFRQGRLDDAAREIDAADRLLPGDATVLLERGLLALSRKEYGKSVDLLTKSLSINPAHAEVFATRGIALEALGRSEEALSDYRTAETKLATDPDGRLAKARAAERIAVLAGPVSRPIEPDAGTTTATLPAPRREADARPAPARQAQNSAVCRVVEGVFSHSRRYTGVEFDVGCGAGK
ncbi:MAG: tetratricopeptide repeat protein [Proteobacteria bacterium]|nr:tetratricopeptide repeat protein [Pseudomonadota bacterium]